MTDDRIKQRLIKILTLSRRGVGGEKDNAERMLNNLLKKHGLTLEDLVDEDVKNITWFRCKNKVERTLLSQCCLKVIDSWDKNFWGSKSRKNQIGIQVTKAQEIELGLTFDAHRRAFNKELEKHVERLVSAYVQRNQLFSSTPSNESEAGKCEISPEDLEAILALMRTMKPTQVHKAIESSRSAS